MPYIIQHGPDDAAWYVQAPRTWTGDPREATVFPSVEEAEKARDHIIEVRYPASMFSQKIRNGVRKNCRIVEVQA